MKWAIFSSYPRRCAKAVRLVGLIAFGLVISLCSGCSNLHREVVQGDAYRHVTASREGSPPSISASNTSLGHGPLHLYINGDGRPFLTPTTIARDPSTRSPYVLQLMRRDSAPSIMIGRPCYHGLRNDPGCDPRLWSTHRYSIAVIDSMVAVAAAKSAGRPTVLIGHSGGGTLALLMAPRMSNVVGVITIAGNLDVAAWTSHHGFSALTGSLNPATNFAATASVPQIHYVGAIDEVVPSYLTQQLKSKLPVNSVDIIAEFDHDCCWSAAWPDLLERAQQHFAHVTKSVQNAAPRSSLSN